MNKAEQAKQLGGVYHYVVWCLLRAKHKPTAYRLGITQEQLNSILAELRERGVK